MGQSLSRILVHATFSTKHRQPLITEPIEAKLHAYVAGIFNNVNSPCIAAGGAPDHIHALFVLSRTASIADTLETVKHESSKWMKTHERRFFWQNGYGAFSIGESGVDGVKKYIAKQKAHHAKLSYQDELRALLKKYNVEYDEQYVWD